MLTASGVVHHVLLKELAKLNSCHIAVPVRIGLSLQSLYELPAKEAVIRYLLLRTAGSDKLAHRLCRLVADVLRHSFRQGEKGAGETAIEYEKGMF